MGVGAQLKIKNAKNFKFEIQEQISNRILKQMLRSLNPQYQQL